MAFVRLNKRHVILCYVMLTPAVVSKKSIWS